MMIFWDIGGVVLTNGWDRQSRAEAARVFDLDLADFETRHARAIDDFDCGRLSLEEYLTNTLFYRARPFTRRAFEQFMYDQSQPDHEVLRILERLATDEGMVMVALNNESLHLNQYRIDRFDLRRYFRCFLSSCYLGARKPHDTIYERAIQIMQEPPEACWFIDDRQENLEPAKRLKMRTVHFVNACQLSRDLTAQL
ncbi:MAG: HAD-IA family hydrolase, partial [Nitrospiraceae bacterium]